MFFHKVIPRLDTIEGATEVYKEKFQSIQSHKVELMKHRVKLRQERRAESVNITGN